MMLLYRCRVILLAFIGTLALAGCIKSQEAKFPPAGAVAALGDGGRYRMHDRVAGGTFLAGDLVEIRKRGDGGYDFIDPASDPTPFTLHAIAGGLHVVQSKNRAGVHEYIVARIAGGEILSYAPDCKKQNKAMLDAFGVEMRDDDCLIDGVKDAAGFFAGLDLGQPTGKLVRE